VTDGRIQRVAKELTPPVVARAARRARDASRRTPPEWEFVPEGWARAVSAMRGWDDDSVLDAYRAKLPGFRAATAGTGPLAQATSAAVPIGPGSVVHQNTTLVFTYALLLASRERRHLSVLDWGGGLAFHSFVARAVLPATVELDYHCQELPQLCALGRTEVPEVTFWDDDRALDRTYDLVVASSSLQYSEHWEDDLAGLAGATGGFALLTRIPVVFDHPSFVVLQRAHRGGVDTEHLSWVFNRSALLDRAAAVGLTLVREFLLGDQPDVVGAPEQDETRAFLFRVSR